MRTYKVIVKHTIEIDARTPTEASRLARSSSSYAKELTIEGIIEIDNNCDTDFDCQTGICGPCSEYKDVHRSDKT